jgi:gentisate 1,2-dioxygenase
MQPGDFVITHSWTWHDHGNGTQEPMVWLDGLGIQIVKLLSASFAEQAPAEVQAVTRPEGDSGARFANNLLPVDWKPEVKTSPVFNYPYARTREALEQLRRSDVWDACHGLKMRYTNPITGNHAMATMATFIQLLPKGFSTSVYRSTDATVFVPIEGKGRSVISQRSGEEVVVDWQKRDIFVVPSWHRVRHEALDGDAVIFSYSDKPIQEALHLFREDRGNA